MKQQPSLDGRGRRRVEAMRRVQAAALGLFERRGYDAVTVEDIARAAKVGPATVYRHFGTKEQVVLWDEYDPVLLGALAGTSRGPPLQVLRDVLVASVARFDGPESRQVLRRAQLVAQVPALERASLVALHHLRRQLAQVLHRQRAFTSALAAEVAAFAAVGALEAALGQWVAGRGRRPLAKLIDDAFVVLGRLRT
jgi:AcrR family transcriptional regulator